MRSFCLSPGECVLHNGVRCNIVAVLEGLRVVIENRESGIRMTAPLQELSAAEISTSPLDPHPLDLYTEKQWSAAESKLAAIRPLLGLNKRTALQVQARSKEIGVGQTSLYRWIRTYERTESTRSLLTRPRSGGPPTKLSPEQEQILQNGIEQFYLKKQRLTPQNLHRELQRMCSMKGVKTPSPGTVRNRLARLNPELVARRRHGAKSQHRNKPLKGSFPGAERPLSVIQIDHTPIDLLLVDEHYRKPLSKPWLTVAIDVYSRMIVGYYCSFESPGDLSTGLCLLHSVMPKADWLREHEIEAEWPCQGLMNVLHLDNAREFHSKTLHRSCSEYGIEITWRPVARPHYGGHIERLIGTTLRQVHTLPGTTFSNVRQKDDYDSEKHATLTLSEFKKILARWVVCVYHQSFHRGILSTPLERYRLGIAGIGTTTGPVPIRLPNDPVRFRLDLLPSIERTIQPYGLVIDEIFYWHDILRPWIHAKDPGTGKNKRMFLFKRDPQDISVVYFFDPERLEYHDVPFRNISHPSLSLWDLRAARKRLKQEGRKAVNEGLIIDAHKKNFEELRTSRAKTKAARLQQSRTGAVSKVPAALIPLPEARGLQLPDGDKVDALFASPIEPFRVRRRS